jgi:hypothetical protein
LVFLYAATERFQIDIDSQAIRKILPAAQVIDWPPQRWFSLLGFKS